ncbi:MAG: energy transducer TonB [Candidatus Marinimicrobia bacterium]|nr:energy transducer TonB [Candidatus Neomarinimicrobiota bacterium]MCF7903041.1 energy transducer TonB [Candidatus Neomarinimicrobiota bacterium]
MRNARDQAIFYQQCDTLFKSGFHSFSDGDYQQAKAWFDTLGGIDSLGLQYEAYAYLAQCERKLGNETGGAEVLSAAIDKFAAIDSNKFHYASPLPELKYWAGIYPKLAQELRPRKDFDLTIQPPGVLGGMQALYKQVDYPEIAKGMGIKGTVSIRTSINTLGQVESARVEKPVHPDLDKAALTAVKATTFTPLIRYGRPIKGNLSVPIVFR